MGTILDKELWDEYLKEYTDEMDKMQTLANANVFIKDNIIEIYKDKNIQKETLKSHIMYRVNLGTEGERPFLLDVKGEGKRYKYEFLVEFDTDTPEYGIYYGCRAVIDPTIQDEDSLEAQIKLIDKDWTDIRGEARKVLSNVFTDKRFGDRTFRRTNNKSNNHYWPFWIALGNEEDVVEVASRATLLIAHIYEKRYASRSYHINKQMLEDSGLPFTKKMPEGKLRTFIGHAVKNGYIVKEELYVGDVYRLNEKTPVGLDEITTSGKKRGPDNGINLLTRIMKYLLKIEVKDYIYHILGKDGEKLNETTLKTIKENIYGYTKEEYKRKFEAFFEMKFG